MAARVERAVSCRVHGDGEKRRAASASLNITDVVFTFGERFWGKKSPAASENEGKTTRMYANEMK